ncbi:alaserpin-like [Bombyx mandarina]|uniref:Alaserpin-like n=1 Tax=Bombyx mandarina TaxID=7092 RepID=A0A6J2K2L3_BOMMA|nr:alaserpin-like [Bombyx mandarina]
MFRVIGTCVILSLVTGKELSSVQLDIDNRLALATQSISLDVLYKHVRDNPGKKFVTSIPPLLSGLGELVPFAKGSTYTQLLDLLNLKDVNEVYRAFPSAYDRFLKENKRTDTPQYFGKVYADDDEPFCKKFTAVVESFSEETGTVDFDDAKEAANDINYEIKRQGSRGFNKLISSSEIDSKGGLIFVSTYEIILKYALKLDITQPNYLLFNSENGKKFKIPAFTLKDSIKYAQVEEIDAQVFEFELQEEGLSVVVFYPNKKDGIEYVLEKLRKPKVFNQILENLEEKCLQVTLPTPNERVKADLSKSLREVRNVSDIYTPGRPQFNGVQKKCCTYVTSNLHENSISNRSVPGQLMSKNAEKCSGFYKKVKLNSPAAYFVVSRSENISPTPVISSVFYGK